jgi:hypothetical protein
MNKNLKLVIEVSVFIIAVLVVSEHLLKILNVDVRPSTPLSFIGETCCSFFHAVGSKLAKFSTYVEYLRLEDFGDSVHSVLKPISCVVFFWIGIFSGYSDFVKTYTSPYVVVFGTLVIITGSLYVLDYKLKLNYIEKITKTVNIIRVLFIDLFKNIISNNVNITTTKQCDCKMKFKKLKTKFKLNVKNQFNAFNKNIHLQFARLVYFYILFRLTTTNFFDGLKQLFKTSFTSSSSISSSFSKKPSLSSRICLISSGDMSFDCNNAKTTSFPFFGLL